MPEKIATDYETQSEYKAPPIIEAIIQLSYADPLGDAELDKLVRRLGREYKNKSATQSINANLDFGKRAATFADDLRHERLSSSDETDALIVNANELSWTRLAPYPGWTHFAARVIRDAELAQELVGYRKLSRMGVRYVNRIDVPVNESGIAQFEDYLAIRIDMPSLERPVTSYAWRFEQQIPEHDVTVIVQSASAQPEIPGTAAFILDIDVVALNNLPAKQDDVFAKLAIMRHIKNEIFEAAILPMARVSFAA